MAIDGGSEGYDSGELVPGRSCQGCTLCCKLLQVEPLEKARGVWCRYCDQKRGCKSYETRPEACRTFYCGWRRIPALDERWKPSQARLLVNYESAANRIVIHVDAGRPEAWRAKPFYPALRQWSRNAPVLVWCGAHLTIVLPDGERDLGEVRDDQYIIPVERQTPQGMRLDFDIVEADDPRAAPYRD